MASNVITVKLSGLEPFMRILVAAQAVIDNVDVVSGYEEMRELREALAELESEDAEA